MLIINETSLNFPNEKVDNLSIVITSPVEAPTYFNELEQTINPYDCLIIKTLMNLKIFQHLLHQIVITLQKEQKLFPIL